MIQITNEKTVDQKDLEFFAKKIYKFLNSLSPANRFLTKLRMYVLWKSSKKKLKSGNVKHILVGFVKLSFKTSVLFKRNHY